MDGGAAQRNIEESLDLIGTKSQVAGYFGCFQRGIGRKTKKKRVSMNGKVNTRERKNIKKGGLMKG